MGVGVALELYPPKYKKILKVILHYIAPPILVVPKIHLTLSQNLEGVASNLSLDLSSRRCTKSKFEEKWKADFHKNACE